MSRTSVSILALTESCVSKFDKLLASYTRGSQRIESLESRLADFNLWADGIGALAKPGVSLDSRLQGRVNDLALVKNVLIMLADSLDHCVGLAEDKTSYDETDHHIAIQNLDSAIKNLALIGVAIRRTGQASRNRRADKTFNPDNHQELRTHLECIIRLRPTEEALFHQKDNGEYVAKSDNSKLSDIQNRLVEANLRRRHKFLIAQKRSRTQKNVQIRPSIPEAPSSAGSVPKEEHLADIQNADTANNPNPTPYSITRGYGSTAPTISRFSLASTAEGTLKYTAAARKYTPSITKTQITFIASDVEFPKAPSIPLGREIMKCPCCCQSLPIGTLQNPKLWKQHIVEDLCPYTCIAENCPTPQLLFCTRNEWESHVKKAHLPRWQCPFCEEQNEDYSTMESMGYHLQDAHEEELSDNSLATLLSWSAVQTMGIKDCPLCSSCGSEDSPELIDHVLRHAYDFALRALPWPQPIVYDLNVLPGSFTIPEDSDRMEDLQHWIKGLAHESVGPPEIQLSDYDGEDHSAPVPTNLLEYSDYFLKNTFFDDKSEDRSSKLQFGQSNDSAYSAVSAHSDISSRALSSVALSTDGRQIASALGENIIKIWNMETGQITKRLKGHDSKVSSVAFSPHSQQLASASVDYYIKIWDIETEVCVQTLTGHNGTIKSMVFSPNSQQLASVADNDTARIWDSLTGECCKTLESHMGAFASVAFSPNGRQLALSTSLDDGTIWIWNLEKGTPADKLPGHTEAVTSFAFSPSGQELASASCDRTIMLWDMEARECKWTSKSHSEPVNSVAYSPNGQLLASASLLDSTIRLWDVVTGACVMEFEDHGAKISSIIISPDSKQILSASDGNAIRVWDIATCTCFKTLMLKDQDTEHTEGYTYHKHSHYTVGWVCASPKEQLAALFMLEHKHKDLPNPVDDDNTYILGRIGGHNVVIACPLIRRTDKDDARTATQMMSTFPNIKVCLMVGTGSGIPPEVRLGDVIVSCAQNGYPAVLQWDMEKDEPLERTGCLTDLPRTLLRSFFRFQVDPHSLQLINSYVNDVETRESVPRNFVKSHLPEDLLFKPGYNHVSKISDSNDTGSEEDYCQLCDKSMLFDRRLRRLNVKIHYGLIASSNRDNRNVNLREKLREFSEDILGIGMEAADLINALPCFAIMGICDYADSHKNRVWQEYAAVTAAACAKALLTELPVSEVARMEAIKDIVPLDVMNNSTQEYDTREMTQSQAEHDKAHVDGGDMKLRDAIMNRNTDAVKFLLSHGTSVQARDENGYTPLHYAAMTGQMDVAELLLNHGADVKAENNTGKTPLHIAASVEEEEMVEWLLKHGADIGAIDGNGKTPLHRAAHNGHVGVAEFLLNHGADIEAQSADGSTPLHQAIWSGQVDAAAFFLNQGANINAKDRDGDTPLHNAISIGQKDVANLLLSNGADIEAKNNSGNTPLHLAAENGYVDIAQLLIDRGANTKAEDKGGNTALRIAMKRGEEDIVKLLREQSD